MNTTTALAPPSLPTGLAASVAVAGAAAALSGLTGVSAYGFGWLPLAVSLGIVIGNLWPSLPSRGAEGFRLARGTLMRAGIALYGLRIGIDELGRVGWSGLLMAVVVVLSTLGLALALGRRLGLDPQLAVLVGCGSAICGAAAVAAADSVIGARARHVSAAVLAVVVFGTLGMYLLPLLHPLTGLSDQSFGLWVGLTVHELGHVVAGAEAAGPGAAASALVEKMMRVMLLAPVVMLIAARWRDGGTTGSCSPGVPLFLYGFIATMALNASGLLPVWLHALGAEAAQALLAVGLAALGANTRLADMALAGWRVWALAALLWIWLLLAGFGLVSLGALS
ncbi:YeiH family protein [Methyloversatilis sp. XJ19-49]|uniref:YeiH family protein n=1 Tax=Methyloversatilis sp. XJ19-49 TaxID=2963429 RepID=UPI00211CFCE7|nr:putative sulfate exporter family transporter [Methyloversatilis sp. XJ19-49]MCQ9376711.1 putative sulfate exporter family transporter [Methyloversatilis sp. XJ19-49]